MKPQIDTTENSSGRFGYDKTNPIPVFMQDGEINYLARLMCECGKPFVFHRNCSCGPGPDGDIVDKYELVCMKRVHQITLYMDMYHFGSSTLVPEGLKLGEPKGIGRASRVSDFPESLLKDI